MDKPVPNTVHPGSRSRAPAGPNRLDRSRCDSILDLFSGERPIEIEIGSGKGRFLLHRAQKHPEIDFIGFDYIWKYLKIGWGRVQKRGIENLLFFKGEAVEVFRHLVPSESISVCHVYFPDPWHKRRHHKRRLLTPDFLAVVHDRLKPGGYLEFATDNFDYLVAFKKSLIEARLDWMEENETTNERILDPEFKTNFELKYEAEGRDLYYVELRKPL